MQPTSTCYRTSILNPWPWLFHLLAVSLQFSSVAQSCPTLCDSMDWACQASLFITNSWSLLKLMSIKLAMPSSYLILCHPLLLLPLIFSSIRFFPNESVLPIRWPKYGVSASASVLPVNIQDWFPLGWLVWSPCSPRDSQESSPTP